MNFLRRVWLLRCAHPALDVVFSTLCVMGFLAFRNHGALATIMWDEWEYNRYSRQLPLSTSDVPYYLFYFIYGSTNMCGTHFLSCAQLLNDFFFASSVPLIYGVGRKLLSHKASVAISMCSVVGGISVYSAHFMPEPLYFFGFWFGVWCLISTVEKPQQPWHIGVFSGIFLAILSLIKLHAIFLIPGLVLFFGLATAYNLYPGGLRNALIASCSLLISFLCARFLLGFLIAGKAGLNLFGQVYEYRAASSIASHTTIQEMLENALPYLTGHILALVAMLGLPLLLMGDAKRNPGTLHQKHLLLMQLVSFSLLLPLLGVVALYTSRLSILDPDIEGAHGLLRLHLRYYNFLFPLLTIITAASATSPNDNYFFTKWRWVVAFCVAFLALAFNTHLDYVELSVADGPELRGFATFHFVTYVFLLLQLVSLILWTKNTRKAALFYMLTFYPLFILMGTAAATYSSYKEKTPNIFQSAGIFARDYLGSRISQLAIIGPEFPGVYQALFYADNPSITPYSNIAENACLQYVPQLSGKEWMLFIGNYALPEAHLSLLKGPGYSLVHTLPSELSVIPCTQSPGNASDGQ